MLAPPMLLTVTVVTDPAPGVPLAPAGACVPAELPHAPTRSATAIDAAINLRNEVIGIPPRAEGKAARVSPLIVLTSPEAVVAVPVRQARRNSVDSATFAAGPAARAGMPVGHIVAGESGGGTKDDWRAARRGAAGPRAARAAGGVSSPGGGRADRRPSLRRAPPRRGHDPRLGTRAALGAVLAARSDLRPRPDPALIDTERQIVLCCAHGHSSSIAAATLPDRGFGPATDIVGRFEAWAAAGLPVTPPEGQARS